MNLIVLHNSLHRTIQNHYATHQKKREKNQEISVGSNKDFVNLKFRIFQKLLFFINEIPLTQPVFSHLSALSAVKVAFVNLTLKK